MHELSRAFAKNGHNVSVLARDRGDLPRETTADGARVFGLRLKYFPLLYPIQLSRALRPLLPRLAPDIIHLHGMGPLQWYSPMAVPLVYTNHTSGYLRRIEKGGARRMAMLKKNFAKVDLFLAPSRELLHIPFDIHAVKQFIANGVDADKFIPDNGKRASVRKRLGIGTADTVAIITRRLVDKNGVIHLARAAQFLENRDVKFIIIGDGPEREAVEKEFHRHCGSRALFLGNRTHQEIVDYYSAADFSVLPSLMEATSISGLEAMASALPLVGTTVGGIPDLISEGQNGYLCQPADPKDLAAKINLLLQQDTKDMGRKSRQMVESTFTWQKISETTLDAYRQILPPAGRTDDRTYRNGAITGSHTQRD